MKTLAIFLIALISLQASYAKFMSPEDEVELYDYELILLNNSEAKCLDGTQPGFYWRKGLNSKNFLVFFEGGGWCGDSTLDMTMQNCYNRSYTDLGSSKNYPKKANFNKDGILSRKLFTNPHFYDWSVAFIKYCDGTGHQGYASDPVRYNQQNLWFRGHVNTNETFNYLLNNLNMNEAKTIVLSGASAGGLAVYNWANYFNSIIPTSAKLFAIPDSGLFLDYPNKNTGNNDYRSTFQNFMLLANQEVDPIDTACVSNNTGSEWKCLFAEHLVNYIKVPTYVVMSQYDSWALANILGETCHLPLNNLALCTDTQKQEIEGYRNAFNQVVNSSISSQNTWGAWTIACVTHCFEQSKLFTDEKWAVPKKSGNTLSDSIKDFIEGKTSVHVDGVAWPNNNPCSNV